MNHPYNFCDRCGRRISGDPGLCSVCHRASSFQDRVEAWLVACFGERTSATTIRERSFRFLEEALELGQSCLMTKDEALQLVEYVYDRPTGSPEQEVGGTMVTLAALCYALGIVMDKAAGAELEHCYASIEKIRAKQASKLQDTPLPGSG